MLCQNCERSIQTATTRLSADEREFFDVVVHASHHTFLESFVRGCLICRHMWKMIVQKLEGEVDGNKVDPPNYGDQIQQQIEQIEELLRSVACQSHAKDLESAISTLKTWERSGNLITCRPSWTPDESYHVQIAFEESRNGKYREPVVGFFDFWPAAQLEYSSDPVLSRTSDRASTTTSARPELWRHWARVCSETHEQCNRLRLNGDFSPKRLIEIIPDEKNVAFRWRLTLSTPGSYLTLSHCWGSTLHVCLTTATLVTFRDSENPVSELPRTYRDAMSIALSLGFRYLWIDSLCIVQDNENDWKEQSSVMGLIYKHASCNIAATWAKDGSQGCFNTRDPAILTPTTITLKAKNLEPETTGEFLIMRSETYWRSVGHAPLNKRGWVLQERYLAPRQINFAEDEVSWECPQLVASEGFPNGLPGPTTTTNHVRLQNSKPRLDYHDQHDLRRAWCDLVRNYSSCKLKFYTDKMIAIAGLAREFRERFDDVYLAGMWRKGLHKQLCWSADDSQSTAGHFRAASYLAPTWSWASCESSVQSDDDFSREERGTAYFTEIMDASVEPQHPSGLHSFVSGNLKVRAIAMWARILEGPDAEDSCPFMITATNPVKNDAFAELVGTDLEVDWDEDCGDEEPEPRKKLQDIHQSDLLLVYVSGIDCSPSDDEEDRVVKVKGLILVPGVNGEFTRAGMFFQYHPETKTVLGIIGGRLGLGPDITGLLDKIDLGDPRLADLVETVSII